MAEYTNILIISIISSVLFCGALSFIIPIRRFLLVAETLGFSTLFV
jgi:hypothetical protein